MSALNFVLPHSSGGGGITSLQFDPQVRIYVCMYIRMLYTCRSSSCRPPLQHAVMCWDIYICMHVFILLPQGKGYREMLADLEVDNAPALE